MSWVSFITLPLSTVQAVIKENAMIKVYVKRQIRRSSYIRNSAEFAFHVQASTPSRELVMIDYSTLNTGCF